MAVALDVRDALLLPFALPEEVVDDRGADRLPLRRARLAFRERELAAGGSCGAFSSAQSLEPGLEEVSLLDAALPAEMLLLRHASALCGLVQHNDARPRLPGPVQQPQVAVAPALHQRRRLVLHCREPSPTIPRSNPESGCPVALLPSLPALDRLQSR